MLIFCISRHFESHVLSIRVTPYLISRQIVELGLEPGGRYSGVIVIRAVAYI